MNITAEHCYAVFCRAIRDYHVTDNVDQEIQNPFPKDIFEHSLYQKNWIDTVQWHLEDIIRDPDIEPAAALTIKRRIDSSNQRRTDRVEEIDDYFLSNWFPASAGNGTRHNSETPGWALDRLSILALKEYHLDAELQRDGISPRHLATCQQRRNVLQEQKKDLLQSINWLLEDLSSGKLCMKSYKQLKMYNDPAFNPVLYLKQQAEA